MAKILVADDNSNIQKMVGLALKDQGIDVVAVGNGEAAVRKISDVRPDLVLADVFMPVRNGYEVCKYVKEDSALAHIPVILLVGAFDPLDEQEAQRVGADGVLKKPFVPPDPLISMVKSALARAGVPYSGTSPAHEDAQQPLRGTDLLTPPRTVDSPPPVPLTETEPPHLPVSTRPEPLIIQPGTQPVAFGNLLETQEDDASYVAPGSSPERTWGSEEKQETEEAEEPSGNAWRPLGGGQEFDDAPAGREDWREKAFQALENIKRDSGRWTPTKEKTKLAEAKCESPVIPAVPEVSPYQTSPQNEIGTGETPDGEDVADTAVISTETVSQASEPIATLPAGESRFQGEGVVEPAPDGAKEADLAPAPEPVATPVSSSAWFSVPSSPWDAEAQKVAQLATTWDAAPSASAARESTEETSPILHEFSQNENAVSPEPAAAPPIVWPSHSTQAIHEEAAHVVEEAIQEVPSGDAGTPGHSAATPNTDEVVAKVLAKMSPDALQAVTKEILKPIIEAIVRDELGKK